MSTVLQEIRELRNEEILYIDRDNYNRYRIVCNEPDRSKTAYYFSTPIYNNDTKKILNRSFEENQDNVILTGSNSKISLNKGNLQFDGGEERYEIDFEGETLKFDGKNLISPRSCIYTTLNGVLCCFHMHNEMKFRVKTKSKIYYVRANDRNISFMADDFRPWFTISCLGVINDANNVIAPVNITYIQFSDFEYQISIKSNRTSSAKVLFEVGVYENKLCQDTTVESMLPKMNNVFGNTAFVGYSSYYGEQWLYSKFDLSRMEDIIDRRIYKVKLHIPKLNNSGIDLVAFETVGRFCSFGSTWNNKIYANNQISESVANNKYYSFDLGGIAISKDTKRYVNPQGIVIRPKYKRNGVAVLATGDSYCNPQILEINYR